MKRFVCALLLVVPATLLAADSATHRYLVATNAGVRPHVLRTLSTVDPETLGVPANRNLVTFEAVQGFAADLTIDEAAALAKSPGVKSVTVAKERHALGFQTSTSAAAGQVTPPGITLVHAPAVWPVKQGDAINVVVIDTGIDFNHPDLKDAYAGGFNTYDSAAAPFDDNDHGTHCAGIIAAANNSIGVVGVAPRVHLWAVKVLDSSGSGSDTNIIQGIDWVIGQKQKLGGNWVMSLSLGSSDPGTELEQAAFQSASDAGIVAVAASGNDSTDTVPAPVSYPAAYPSVIAVGAIDASTSTIAFFSNQGPELKLVAPGINVRSTLPVGSGSASDVTPAGGVAIAADSLTGSPKGDVTGQFVACGIGNPTDFTSSVKGKIAVIQRGTLTFHDKAQNAKNAGAIGVVIYNNDTVYGGWTLIRSDDVTGQSGCDSSTQTCHDDPADLAYAWPVTVGMTKADGLSLLAQTNSSVTESYRADDYGSLSGTSMATPHVAGVVGLIWSLAPTATGAQITTALLQTAKDLGTPGLDNAYGYGLVDASAAALLVDPQDFGIPALPPPQQPRHGRTSLHRGKP
jgi:serine protease